MRNVKCKLCRTPNPIDQAFKVIHTTSGGVKSNQYYCSQEEYENDRNEKVCRNKFDLKMDELFGYPVINNYKRTIYNTILNGGYTNQEMYNCLLAKFSDISDSLGYRSDIENETQKIQYIYAIIKNSIRDITTENRRKDNLNNRLTDKESSVFDYYEDDIQELNVNKKETKKGLFDIIGRI